MGKVLKNIVNEVITMKKNYIIEVEETEDLERPQYSEYGKIDKTVSHLLDLLKPKVSEDIYKMILDVVEMEEYQTTLYGTYLFKKGVIAGVTDLNFLREVKNIAYIDVTDKIGE